MKKYLCEEEYNQIISIGKIDNISNAKKLGKRLEMMGIDSYVDGDEFYISVEQDRNDPHYVDDIANIAKKEYNKLCGMSIPSSFKLAENEFKWICQECISRLIESSFVNDALFAIVKAQAKKMARKKIMQMFMNKRDGAENTPRSKFDACVINVCDSCNYSNEREIAKIINNAIDCVMDAECKQPNLSEYDMFSKINNGISNFINL